MSRLRELLMKLRRLVVFRKRDDRLQREVAEERVRHDQIMDRALRVLDRQQQMYTRVVEDYRRGDEILALNRGKR